MTFHQVNSFIHCMSYLYCFYYCFFIFYFLLYIFLFIVLCVFLYFIITASLCVLTNGWMDSGNRLTVASKYSVNVAVGAQTDHRSLLTTSAAFSTQVIYKIFRLKQHITSTSSSAVAKRPRDASCLSVILASTVQTSSRVFYC